MKKSVKGIIGLSAALVVLGGGLTALLLTDPSKNEEPGDETSQETTEPESANIVIIHDSNVTGNDPETGEPLEGVIKTVDVKNQSGQLHVIQKSSKTENYGATYTLDGYQDVNMEDSIIGTLANNANELTCEAVIEENASDLAKFGLADPVITVDITYESGSKCTMYIGNEAPKGSETYVMIKGSDTVYTVRNSAVANYSKSLEDFVNKTIVKAPDEELITKNLRIEREDIDYDIYLEYAETDSSQFSGGTSASHIMKEPTEAYLAVERSSEITSGMFDLYAKSVYSIHCKDSDIAKAGLDEPFCTVTMNCDNGDKYTLFLSEVFTDDENEKCCYAMVEGGNVIFAVRAADAQWVTVQPVDIASTIFIASYVWSVDKLSITAGDKSYEYVVSKKDPGAELESPKSSDFTAKLNGNEVDAERFRTMYSFLISANAESFALGEKIPSGKPLAVVTYNDYYNKKSPKIEFYEYSAMKALIVVDGEPKFFIARSFVDTLIANAERSVNGEDLVTTWK